MIWNDPKESLERDFKVIQYCVVVWIYLLSFRKKYCQVQNRGKWDFYGLFSEKKNCEYDLSFLEKKKGLYFRAFKEIKKEEKNWKKLGANHCSHWDLENLKFGERIKKYLWVLKYIKRSPKIHSNPGLIIKIKDKRNFVEKKNFQQKIFSLIWELFKDKIFFHNKNS